MSHHAKPMTKPLLTPGVYTLLALIGIGAGVALYRFIFGIGAMSNLNNQYPWGIWIGIDVASGVALAAGGFTTSALVHIFHKEHFHAIVRPALLTAMLGYTFVALGLMVDLGKYYNIWHPMVPSNWQGNSALFEVAMCVMCYLTVLYLEFAPVVLEGLRNTKKLPPLVKKYEKQIVGFVSKPKVEKMMKLGQTVLGKIMFALIILGVVLSCMHQSSLGALMVIAPYKVHALWYTPILSLLFLMSAVSVGFPMVIFESLIASKIFNKKPEMKVLTPLARYIPIFLGIYLIAKVSDLIIRGAYVHLLEGSLQSTMYLFEISLGVILPFGLLLSEKIRKDPLSLFVASALVVLGVVMNRVNVFLIAYQPPYAASAYVPSLGEIAITVALISTLMLCYRVIVSLFPVIEAEDAVGAEVESVVRDGYLANDQLGVVFTDGGLEYKEDEEKTEKAAVEEIKEEQNSSKYQKGNESK